MAVLSVTSLQVKPDQWEAFLDTQRRSKAVLERCGATNVRLIVGMTAGEASGTLVQTFEAPDYAASGAILDKFLADPEGLALMGESNSVDGPTAGWQSSLWSDIPL
jgi:hypothetical protein